MTRPPPGLVTSVKEASLPFTARRAASRAISTSSKGGASKLARPALKFQRPIKPQARNASTRTAPPPQDSPSFLRLLYDGVFKSVQSAAIPRPGPYSAHRLAPRSSTPAAFRQATTFSSARPRPSSRFGPTPRPAVYPTQTSQLGLGAARKFSSSGYAVFENVVHNAPIALRALADQGKDGLDERKWRKIRREIRKHERTDVKGKGRIEVPRMQENVSAEFAEYFGARALTQQRQGSSSSAAEPISLFLVLDPEIAFASTSSASTDSRPANATFDASYRLLPTAALNLLEEFTQSYTSHANRLRGLINRLSAAGLLDDPLSLEASICVEQHSGKRIWKLVFKDGLLTRSRLESVLRGTSANARTSWESKVSSWNGMPRLGKGEGEWWWIQGGSQDQSASLDVDLLADPVPSVYLHDSPLSSSLYPSSASDSPPLPSFVLPDPQSTASVSSLELSPPLSPSLEPTMWTSFTSESPDFAFGEPEFEDFDAVESWSNRFEDEESVTDEWSSAGSVLPESNALDEQDGVKQFLEEIESERRRLGDVWR
ncbi:uncharacterized protein JCM15063_002187 [Sporobolomyces koalae]|uniref:uncharacterized protein n=1 Tax=Sporobolomyces koalae TaxID=500713 RepID=UPI003174811F